MKKFFCVLLMISAVTAGSVATASAMDFLIGAKAGYFIWDPYLKDCGPENFESLKSGTGALYGPVISVMFTPDFSLSVSGLFGEQSAHWTTMDYTGSGSTDISDGTFSMDVKRIDLDSAISYRFTENFKFFAGYKYQYYELKLKANTFERNPGTGIIDSGSNKENDIKTPFNGPAAGIGFSVPFADKFFFAANLSVLYMWGTFELEEKQYQYDSTGPDSDNGKTSKITGIKMNSRGINFEPTIGASLGEGLPLFTVGVRFQWSQIKFTDRGDINDINNNWNNDYQYGLFISIVQPI